MRALRFVAIGLVLLVLAAAALAYLQPRHVIVERATVIDAPPEEVFVHLNSLQAFSVWSPWSDRDPEMMVSFSGPDTGVGNTMEWQSENPQVGNGRQEIVEVAENERVVTTLAFEGMGAAQAWFRLEPEGDGTRVIWGLDSDMGNSPIGRWMGLFVERFVGADYETGLASLKAIVEG